jgi:hypothetical protein
VDRLATLRPEFVNLGPAAEPVRQNHSRRRHLTDLGQQHPLGALPAQVAMAGLEAEVAGEAGAATAREDGSIVVPANSDRLDPGVDRPAG